MEVELCSTAKGYFCGEGILLPLTFHPLLFPSCDIKSRNDSRSHEQLGLLSRSPDALDSCPSLCLCSFIHAQPGSEFRIHCGLRCSIKSMKCQYCKCHSKAFSQVFQLMPKFKHTMATLNPRDYSHACCKYLKVRMFRSTGEGGGIFPPAQDPAFAHGPWPYLEEDNPDQVRAHKCSFSATVKSFTSLGMSPSAAAAETVPGFDA